MKQTSIINTEKLPTIYKTQKIKNKQENKIKPLLKIILISCFILIIVATIIIVIIFILKKNKTKEDDKNNSINAIYKIESNKDISFINYDKLGLKVEDFKIEELEFIPDNKNDLRVLKLIDVEDGKYTPTMSGNLKVKILFNIYLNNLDNIFKGKTELIEVDLGDFEMKNEKV